MLRLLPTNGGCLQSLLSNGYIYYNIILLLLLLFIFIGAKNETIFIDKNGTHFICNIYVSRNSDGFESTSIKLKGANASELLLSLFCFITLTHPAEEYTVLLCACLQFYSMPFAASKYSPHHLSQIITLLSSP
jgi:hypothetical protein